MRPCAERGSALLLLLPVVVLAALSSLGVAALPQRPPLHAALDAPHRTLSKRASDDPRLSDVSRLEDDQLEGLLTLLNRTATKSWEIGTHLTALVELSYPDLSPFSSSSSSWARPSPDVSPPPTEVLAAVASILASQPAGQAQLVPDGSAADPASVGPYVVLANFTLAEGEQIGGKSKDEVVSAVERQVEVLLRGTPRTQDGAISHRTEDVELWSDFMYMVPPFFAYLGALTSNTSLLTAAYTQCELYRSHLRDERTGLWRHINNQFEGGGGMADDGLWATGNGWAAAGMARVLATYVNHPDSDVVAEFASQSSELSRWIAEIVNAAWAQPRAKYGLRYNYLNDTSSFADASGTALLAAATFRLSVLSIADSVTAPSTDALDAAEGAYRAVVPSRVSSAGVVSPVVDPMSFSDPLDDARADGSGQSSPEAAAFVLLLEAARRDWVESNGGVEPQTTAQGDSGSGGGPSAGARSAGALCAAVVAGLLAVGLVA
ncbi:Six-hairpin glycosidase-like protein [Rhodotorula diobovata]|uniref:Six-hairpin glycosidase-like protein n=1 Tax=Rhodotorula diobovata TaxID=5288 RepID=A0A5C5FL91_9BASI|nr:Six-hairpin glycosidase-like protein [Rhodotorula diobovata]